MTALAYNAGFKGWQYLKPVLMLVRIIYSTLLQLLNLLRLAAKAFVACGSFTYDFERLRNLRVTYT